MEDFRMECMELKFMVFKFIELKFIECKFGFRVEWGLAGGGMSIDLVAYSKCAALLGAPKII